MGYGVYVGVGGCGVGGSVGRVNGDMGRAGVGVCAEVRVGVG